MQKQTRAATLHKGEFQRLIKITKATSNLPERDVLVLMLGHKAGLRITEISRITVADVMFPSGKLRQEVSMRAAVTKGCRPRSAFIVHKQLTEALETYLQHRLARGIGTGWVPSNIAACCHISPSSTAPGGHPCSRTQSAASWAQEKSSTSRRATACSPM